MQNDLRDVIAFQATQLYNTTLHYEQQQQAARQQIDSQAAELTNLRESFSGLQQELGALRAECERLRGDNIRLTALVPLTFDDAEVERVPRMPPP